jgi:uncharacterized repeat protein (TIGR03837 family)
MPEHIATHCDIFCNVIDNLGDIGTCWRLASILRDDHAQNVRLWVDDLQALQTLVPDIQLHHQTDNQPTAHQVLHGIQVHHWMQTFPHVTPADLVIETFGCTLPASYIQAMRERTSAPIWINLEYFSAEAWVANCHKQPSLLPNGLKKYFYFPGIAPHSGGLLREKHLLQERSAFLANPQQQLDWCAHWHIPWHVPDPQENSLKISLFAYENPQLPALLDSLSHADQPVTAYLPASRLLNSLRDYTHNPTLKAGDSYQHGNLSLHVAPFLPQSEYDRLLWLCDINFVRGEESLTRAIWAGKPFIWHIYPTEDAAHHDKLNAFLDAYTQHADQAHLQLLRAGMQHWNGILKHETDAYTLLTTLHRHQDWYEKRMRTLAQIPELSQQLLDFGAFITSTGYNAARK